jgi:signal transduction histidine kinase
MDLIFTVEDTGIGIPEEEHDSIFEAFTQQKRDRAISKYGGNGVLDLPFQIDWFSL